MASSPDVRCWYNRLRFVALVAVQRNGWTHEESNGQRNHVVGLLHWEFGGALHVAGAI